jgi:hypothetical protein
MPANSSPDALRVDGRQVFVVVTATFGRDVERVRAAIGDRPERWPVPKSINSRIVPSG